MKEFYRMIQTSETRLKQQIHESESAKDRAKYFGILALRAALVVCFAVLFVTIITTIFGAEFSAIAVVLVVMILTIQFIHFSYCIRDTALTLAVVMLILVFMPTICMYVPAWSLFFIHFISLLVLVSITCQNPRMGLGGMIGFAYAYLMGNPVSVDHLPQEIGVFAVAYVICLLIMIHKHRNKDRDVRYRDLIRLFNFRDPKNLWHLRLALGVSIILTFGMALNIPRFIWLSFPCSSILAQYPYAKDSKGRIWERIEGIAIGSVGFYILCQIIPESMYSLIGLIGGFVLGFCTKYRNKTIVICFGALTTAAALYGVEGAAFLRIMNNVIGAIFATLFALAFDALVVKRLVPDQSKL